MNLTPLFEADWIIILHALLAVEALLIGAVQLILKKGTALHKLLGKIWVATLFVVAASSFFIHEIRLFGPFSPIHFLSIFVLYTLVEGVQAARRGNIKKHKKSMTTLYFAGLVLAGAFTLVPGRVFYRIFFGA